MRIPFSLYDFLGYTLPGIIVMVIALILVKLEILEHRLNDLQEGLAYYLPNTVVQGVLYVFAGYLVGFIFHGFSEFVLKIVSDKWKRWEKFYTDKGSFINGLFNPNCRDSREDFNPYSKQFIREFRKQVEAVFSIKVDRMETAVEYTEIFDLCRSVLIKQSPALYSRAFVLLVKHESAKLLISIFFLATLGFLVRGIPLWCSSASMNVKWWVAILAVVNCLLFFLFRYMYKRLLRYYRNTVIYGFYEYAVNREKPGESRNNEN